LLKTLDGEILEVTEVEDMEQEIMDTEIQTQATVNHSYLIHSIIQDSQLLTLTLHISLCKLVSDLRPIDILTGEIAIEVTGVVGVSPALWYFRYIASIFLIYTSACALSR
jgi:hypothetical protein